MSTEIPAYVTDGTDTVLVTTYKSGGLCTMWRLSIHGGWVMEQEWQLEPAQVRAIERISLHAVDGGMADE